MDRKRNSGFTLVELSIVLVIIGLIVGGVLVGQDLIAAAAVRAQISQIEKYNTAVHTFQAKYGELPGDLDENVANACGFGARGQLAGEGDDNGVIEGIGGTVEVPGGVAEAAGETVMFWVDLSAAGLIDGSFNTASATVFPPDISGVYIPGTEAGSYFPAAKIGGGNSLYVWSGGMNAINRSSPSNGINYFALSHIIEVTEDPLMESFPALTVAEAYAIDNKMDDGYPQSGTVTALYVVGGIFWASGGFPSAGASDPTTGGAVVAGDGVATQPSAITCYDNGNAPGAIEQYSMSQNNGAGVNCALSFQFE